MVVGGAEARSTSTCRCVAYSVVCEDMCTGALCMIHQDGKLNYI